jgi:hypothetical protein
VDLVHSENVQRLGYQESCARYVREITSFSESDRLRYSEIMRLRGTVWNLKDLGRAGTEGPLFNPSRFDRAMLGSSAWWDWQVGRDTGSGRRGSLPGCAARFTDSRRKTDGERSSAEL